MAEILQLHYLGLAKFKPGSSKFSPEMASKRMPRLVRWRRPLLIECFNVTEEKEGNKRSSVVKNGNDSLDICRVVNGMWQTSGGWGRIERDSAVDAMLKYADSGLTTFDMADICMPVLDNHKFTITSL